MQEKMFGKINVAILVTFCLIGATVRWTDAQCQECMENFAYCVNTTHFYPCYDGKTPSKEEILQCGVGQVCTTAPDICVTQKPLPPIQPACPDDTAGSCETCDTGTNKFACVSKTQYSLCVASTPQSATESCGPNEICSVTYFAEYKKICIPECVSDFLQYQPTCSNDVRLPTTTTAPIIDPPDLKALAEHCELKCKDATKGYCYTNNLSSDCKSYLYCEKNKEWDFVILQCPTNQFWNAEKEACTAEDKKCTE